MSLESSTDFSDFSQPPLCVVYSGRVQGVGFRWTCQSIAKRYPVTGTVKNLLDGNVELQVDGAGGDVQAFLSEIRRRMEENIENADIRPAHEKMPFADFRIIR
jgi:acylphosphatase